VLDTGSFYQASGISLKGILESNPGNHSKRSEDVLKMSLDAIV
jgi:hypothetical protein